MSLTLDQLDAMREIASGVISEVSPGERLLLDSCVDAIAREKELTTRSRGRPLGFGGAVEYAFILPVLLPLLKVFADATAKKLGDEFADSLAKHVSAAATQPVPSDATDLAKAAKRFEAKLLKQGADKKWAKTAADAFVATLVRDPNLLTRLRGAGT